MYKHPDVRNYVRTRTTTALYIAREKGTGIYYVFIILLMAINWAGNTRLRGARLWTVYGFCSTGLVLLGLESASLILSLDVLRLQDARQRLQILRLRWALESTLCGVRLFDLGLRRRAMSYLSALWSERRKREGIPSVLKAP
jgi:hypothetical protein